MRLSLASLVCEVLFSQPGEGAATVQIKLAFNVRRGGHASRSGSRPPRLSPPSLLLALLVAMTVRCGEGFRQDELACERASAHLADCCPQAAPVDGLCRYVEASGCDAGEFTDEVLPVFDVEQAKCLDQMSCGELVASGTCEAIRRTVVPTAGGASGAGGGSAGTDDGGSAGTGGGKSGSGGGGEAPTGESGGSAGGGFGGASMTGPGYSDAQRRADLDRRTVCR